jgi:tRNA(Ile)-lysidine synthase
MTKHAKAKARQPKSKLSFTQPVSLTPFARSLLREWRRLELPLTKTSVVIAVSGGADSAALLFALDELIQAKKIAVKLVVAHLNHRLRGKESQADARWVRLVSETLGHSFAASSVDVLKQAAKAGDNLEQAARRARYAFLRKVASTNRARVVLTAHTMDDQAETFLLNLLRGSGADGLAGIDLARPIEPHAELLLVRPLISWATRADTENYCRKRAIDFRVDAMNVDEKLTRVRVRRQLLPLLKTFNPNFVAGLARTMEILREDNLALDAAAMRLLDLAAAQADRQTKSLRADLLKLAPLALRRRALRSWLARSRGNLRRIESAHVNAIAALLNSSKSGRVVELPGGSSVSRHGGFIHFHAAKAQRRK